MNSEMNSVQPRLVDELKARTRPMHDALQQLAYFDALAASSVPIESYVGHLRSMSVIHGLLEHAIETRSNPNFSRVWSGDMRKLPLLEKDLRFFEPRAVADLRESAEIAQNIAAEISLRLADQPISLLGILYVLEGSTRGAVRLAPQVAKTFMLHGDDGLGYLHSYGTTVETHWIQFQQRMNALTLSDDERELIVAAACEFFAGIKPLFAALYPVNPESKTYLVTSINPEAGRHPIPADSREIAAALRAATRCWDDFPYYEMRYGERGRRYANSDGAWLATLGQFEQARVNQQVKWLARVLATRGMPTIMLQVKLEYLYEELVAVIPEKKAEYERLAVAASELHAARCLHIDDNALQTIADAFDSAVGSVWQEKLKYTGTLLACAVADQLEGTTSTSESLETWMTDSARFPGHWIAAVRATLSDVKAHSSTKAHVK